MITCTSGSWNFNPRSPWGERLFMFKLEDIIFVISIHAPRGGSDDYDSAVCRLLRHFNPRSPWGERRQPITNRIHFHCISIHAPRGGSDAINFT